jgi:cysteinyl-tRNA synthetase
VDVAPYKRSEFDFVLWKPSTGDMPGWESPWGFGRPGWHIECSAMAWRHLGEEFDIHGGGSDLIFPHHENEVAQSVCAFPGTHFAKVWMHNGMLLVDGQKMSKSLGNFFTLRDILDRGPWVGEAYRLLLLKTHYRAPLDFTFAGLEEARRELDDLYRLRELAEGFSVDASSLDPLGDEVVSVALCADLNTPLAIAGLHALGRRLRQGPEAHGAAAKFLEGLSLLGICPRPAAEWFRGGEDNVSDIEAAIAARLAARKARDFAEADRIRDELKARGIVLEDSASGTTWRRAS